MSRDITLALKTPHERQQSFIASTAKRIVLRAGRRSGKTVGVSILAVQRFLQGERVLYCAPTIDQVSRFWTEVTRALQPAVESKLYTLNKTNHIIERPGTEQRIKAKTVWSPETLRGDYASLIIFDEYQLQDPETWETVGSPMCADKDATAYFIYTPPSLARLGSSNTGRHASEIFKKAKADTTGRWETFVFSSYDNPHISRDALLGLSKDMSSVAYRMEILAEDIDEAPGALWTRQIIEETRHANPPPMERIVVGVDPAITATGDAAGIIVAGMANGHGYVLEDCSIQGSPAVWAQAAVDAFHRYRANLIVAEANQGGDMVRSTIASIDKDVPVRMVWAKRGKLIRAEPISARYEAGQVHHVGNFPALEDQMCLFQPGVGDSPNDLDAAVYALSELLLGAGDKQFIPSSVLSFCRSVKLPREGWEWQPGIMGIAVPLALNAVDPLVICLRQGRHVHEFARYFDETSIMLCERIATLINQVRPAHIVIEDMSGADIGARLRNMGYRVTLDNLNNKQTIFPEQHYDRYSQAWDRMKSRLAEGAELPNDPELFDELSSVEFKLMEKGALKVDNYQDVRRKGIKPPMAATALALTYTVSTESIVEMSADPESENVF